MNSLRIFYVSNLIISNIALYFFDKHIDILLEIIVLKVKTYDVTIFFSTFTYHSEYSIPFFTYV